MEKTDVKHKKDILIVALALLAAGGLWLFAQRGASLPVTTVVATVDGVEVLRRPLVMNAVYEIPNAEGLVNIICVENGAVHMQEANCRDGLCIRQGKMKNAAKTIVCLPNRVVVSLVGDTPEADGVDDIDVIIQ